MSKLNKRLSWLFKALTALKKNHELAIIAFLLLVNILFTGIIFIQNSRLISRNQVLDGTIVSLNMQYIKLEEAVSAQKEQLDGIMNTLLRVQAQLFRLGPGDPR